MRIRIEGEVVEVDGWMDGWMDGWVDGGVDCVGRVGQGGEGV